jgi:hypothetical protein
VVPSGLAAAATAAPVVIFNNGALIRTSLRLNFAQPDIATTTNGPGGRAVALNVTNVRIDSRMACSRMRRLYFHRRAPWGSS